VNILENTRDKLIMLNENTPSQVALIELITHNEFVEFWLNFKYLCDKNIGGMSRLQRGYARFVANTWKDSQIPTLLKTVGAKDQEFFHNLNTWASGHFSPPCQCQSVSDLLKTGIAPDQSVHLKLAEEHIRLLKVFADAGQAECRKVFTCVPEDATAEAIHAAKMTAKAKRDIATKARDTAHKKMMAAKPKPMKMKFNKIAKRRSIKKVKQGGFKKKSNKRRR
jgi:hypothetical protein